MKNVLVMIALGLLSASAANAGDKICMVTRDGTMTNMPCQMGKKTAQTAFLRMLLLNTEGYKALVSPVNQVRLEMLGVTDDTVRATALSDSTGAHGGGKTVIQYEVVMDDCGTTDTCGTKFVWTVTETTESDGYVVDTSYANSLVPVQQFPSWAKVQQ